MGGGDIFEIGVGDCEVIYGLIHKVKCQKMRIVYLEEGDFQTEIFNHSFYDENQVLFHPKENWDTFAPLRTSFVACGERSSH